MNNTGSPKYIGPCLIIHVFASSVFWGSIQYGSHDTSDEPRIRSIMKYKYCLDGNLGISLGNAS